MPPRRKHSDTPRTLTLDMIPARTKAAFWDRVEGAFEEPSRCWPWIGAYKQQSRTSPYPARPVQKIAGVHHYAYRVAYLLAKGKLPRRLLRHKCNNEKCCNPDHLVPSTKSRNAKDHYARLRGERACGRPDCCDGTDLMEER